MKQDKRATTINRLHGLIAKADGENFERAMEAGELLHKVRRSLPDSFDKWAKENLTFSRPTVYRYLSVFENRDVLNRLSVRQLSTAYDHIKRLKEGEQNKRRTVTREARKQRIRKEANKRTKYKNPPKGNYVDEVWCGDNLVVMEQMINDGMGGKYAIVGTSPPYNNASMDYGVDSKGKKIRDDLPYADYLEFLIKPFHLYTKLLRKGGRVIYNVARVAKDFSGDNGDCYCDVDDDLKRLVKERVPELVLMDRITWYKRGSKNNIIKNNKTGTFDDPRAPRCRICSETILVWGNGSKEMDNEEGTEKDLSPKEADEARWDVWEFDPYVHTDNFHPCSFPAKMINLLLRGYSYPGCLVVDPYNGAGITCVEARATGRHFTGIERNPNFCRLAKQLLKQV